MSDTPPSAPPLDLSDLRLMPQWVADFSKAAPRPEADYSDEGSSRGNDRRGPRDDRRGGGGAGFRGDRRDAGAPRGERKPFERPTGPPRGDNRGAGPRDDRRGSGPPRGNRDRRGGPRDDRRPHPQQEEGPRPVPGISVSLEPEAKATEAMAAMIRTAGKAYSVFDAARLVLASGDRFHVRFTLPADSPLKLCVVPANGSVWMSREEAVSNFLHSEGLNEFYREETVELEEPKGNFTSVAVCGMSGEILGPPSHHSFQHSLHKIHRERFSHMAFEDYRRRVRNDNAPETIEKWKESQKHGQQWVYLSPAAVEGEEPLRFKSRAEMESHFRRTHAETLVHETNDRAVLGNIPKKLLNASLYIHLRRAVDEARKHLLSTAQQLCSGFESHGLKLFKRRGGKLWVSRNRPRALESDVILSDRISKIVNYVRLHPGVLAKELVEKIEPHIETAPEATPVAPAAEAAPAEGEGATPLAETEAPAPAPAEKEATPQAHALNDAQLQVLKDIHWLNSEGYVIEYADGVIYPGVTEPPPAKPKQPKQPKAEAKPPGEATSETAEAEAATAESEASPAAEPEAEQAEATNEAEATEPSAPSAEATKADETP